MNCALGIQYNCKSECCGIVPFEKSFVQQNRHKATVEFKPYLLDSGYGVCLTEDFLCIFLDRKLLKCAVYEQRPEICKLYGESDKLPCPIISNTGELRTRAERRRIIKSIPEPKTIFDKLIHL